MSSLNTAFTDISCPSKNPLAQIAQILRTKPEYDSQRDYVSECKRIRTLNTNLKGAKIDLGVVHEFLASESKAQETKLRWYELIQRGNERFKTFHDDYDNDVKKTKRRKVSNFICSVGGCLKQYGSLDALNLHMKNKHPKEFLEFRGLGKKKCAYRQAKIKAQKSENCAGPELPSGEPRMEVDMADRSNSNSTFNFEY
jgi:uncharacterized Zn-finger protein